MREVVYDKAFFKPLPENSYQSIIVPRLLIFHTNGGPSTSSPLQLYTYLKRADVNLECTFDIGSDGAIWQFMGLDRRADCNYLANPIATSVETQDTGYKTVGIDRDPWTTEQCDAIVKLMVWWSWSTTVPLVRATRWDGFGVGIHKDFPEWSAAGHSCPGLARAQQFDALLKQAWRILNPLPPLLLSTGTQKWEGNFMDVIRQDTGEFWRIWANADGSLVAAPFSQIPRGADEERFSKIRDRVIGPLVVVPGEDLQAMYDVQGKGR